MYLFENKKKLFAKNLIRTRIIKVEGEHADQHAELWHPF